MKPEGRSPTCRTPWSDITIKNVCAFDVTAAHKGVGTLLHVLGLGVKAREKNEQLVARGKFDYLDLPEISKRCAVS